MHGLGLIVVSIRDLQILSIVIIIGTSYYFISYPYLVPTYVSGNIQTILIYVMKTMSDHIP